MADKAWKAFERRIALILSGTRYWANSGQRLDVDAPGYAAQCKLVKTLSLAQLTALAEDVAHQAQPQQIPVVAVKLRQGRGRPTPILFVLTEQAWRQLNGPVEQPHEGEGSP